MARQKEMPAGAAGWAADADPQPGEKRFRNGDARSSLIFLRPPSLRTTYPRMAAFPGLQRLIGDCLLLLLLSSLAVSRVRETEL